MDDETVFGEAARQQGATAEGAARTLRQLGEQLAPGPFYVYRLGEGGSGGGRSGTKGRTLLAFSTGDDALAFAQRNRLGPTPRLLRLRLPHILTIMLHRPSVEAVLFVAAVGDDLAPGQLPDGRRVARSALLALLAGDVGQD